MIQLSLSAEFIGDVVPAGEIRLFDREVALHRKNIYARTGRGNDYLGWVDLPEQTDEGLIARIGEAAAQIREQSEVVVVAGIGGSYLGARAVIEALQDNFSVGAGEETDGNPVVVYAGHHLDESYHQALLKFLDQRNYSVIVISKSGTTTEPAVAFRLLRKHLEGKYGGRKASSRVFAVTDASSGALKQLADEQGYTSFVIPDDVGGRYSVFSPVGLLPVAVAGFDIKRLLDGARAMAGFLRKQDGTIDNPASLYAVARNVLYRKGKNIEILAGYTPRLHYLTEWWKQLYGESEGKEGKGIFPAGAGFTTDLHSLGQYIQDGMRNVFETVILAGEPARVLTIPEDEANLDGLNYLAGKRIHFVNEKAAEGTMMAHVEGGVPNLQILLPSISETTLGELMYFFQMGCALSGYILGVNPFDQPGVEQYKRNMFRLLGKPGSR